MLLACKKSLISSDPTRRAWRTFTLRLMLFLGFAQNKTRQLILYDSPSELEYTYISDFVFLCENFVALPLNVKWVVKLFVFITIEEQNKYAIMFDVVWAPSFNMSLRLHGKISVWFLHPIFLSSEKFLWVFHGSTRAIDGSTKRQ